MRVQTDIPLISDKVWANAKLLDKRTSTTTVLGDIYHDTALSYNTLILKANTQLWGDSEGVNKTLHGSDLMKKWFNLGFIAPITNQFNYNITSDWVTSEIGKMLSLGVEGYVAGIGEIGSVYKSKQYWKNSGYLTITPQVRVVDWNGDGTVMLQALQLVSYCTSLYTDDLGMKDFAAGLKDKVSKWWEDFKKKYDVDAKVAANKELTSILDNVYVRFIMETGGDMKDEYLNMVSDLTNLRYSPPTLRVQWGKMFRHNDMILESLNITFSTEQTEMGPLYMDVSMTLKSRTIISTFDDTGLLYASNNGGRVEFVNPAGGTERSL